MGLSHVVLHLNRTSDRRRLMAGLPQMRCMDEQVTRRLRRSSMGRSEVVTRWLVISMASSLESARNNDVGSCSTAMIAGVDFV
jgi:hypothetical protein